MALGGVAGILRWSLMGVVPGLGAAAALQLLHAADLRRQPSAARCISWRGRVPPGAAASAQSLYARGLGRVSGSGLVMLAAGALYGAYGGQAMFSWRCCPAAGLAGTVALARSGRRLSGRQPATSSSHIGDIAGRAAAACAAANARNFGGSGRSPASGGRRRLLAYNLAWLAGALRRCLVGDRGVPAIERRRAPWKCAIIAF